MARSEHAVRAQVKRLDRADCQRLLEDVGIAVYDHEKVGTLRTAVVVNVLDGTIRLDALDALDAA